MQGTIQSFFRHNIFYFKANRTYGVNRKQIIYNPILVSDFASNLSKDNEMYYESHSKFCNKGKSAGGKFIPLNACYVAATDSWSRFLCRISLRMSILRKHFRIILLRYIQKTDFQKNIKKAFPTSHHTFRTTQTWIYLIDPQTKRIFSLGVWKWRNANISQAAKEYQLIKKVATFPPPQAHPASKTKGLQ